jgi:hypothetical protein
MEMEDKLLDARIKALLMAARVMAFVIVAITCAMIVGLFVSNDIIDNKDVFGLLSYVMTSVVGAVAGSYATLMGMKGDLVPPPPEDRSDPDPEPEAPKVTHEELVTATAVVETAPEPVEEAPVAQDDDDDDDDEMEPWEKYRGDLRYDANGDGVVDENDFPDWRSAGK